MADVRVAELVMDESAARLYQNAARSEAVHWLFEGESFDEAVDAWLGAHEDWARHVKAELAIERAVRDTVADAVIGCLVTLDMDERARRHYKRAPGDLARQAVERAQEHGFDRVAAFRKPTEKWAARGNEVPMPFRSNLLGWLYGQEHHEVTELLEQRKRESGGVITTAHGDAEEEGGGRTTHIDPPAESTLDNDPQGGVEASLTADAWRSFLDAVRLLLLNPGDDEVRLLSADLRAGARQRELATTLAVAAALAEVLDEVLATGDRVGAPTRWWSDLDQHFVAACRLAVPAKAESEGWRARQRANVGHALSAAMAICATSDSQRALARQGRRQDASASEMAAAVEAWTAAHLKNFVQKGPADDKPLARVEARIGWWQWALSTLEQVRATASLRITELAGEVLADTGSWLRSAGVPNAAKRWLALEEAALDAVRRQREEQVARDLDALAAWQHHLASTLAPPPLATLELAAQGVPVPRLTAHQTSEAVLLAFIEVDAMLSPDPPPAEQVIA